MVERERFDINMSKSNIQIFPLPGKLFWIRHCVFIVCSSIMISTLRDCNKINNHRKTTYAFCNLLWIYNFFFFFSLKLKTQSRIIYKTDEWCLFWIINIYNYYTLLILNLHVSYILSLNYCLDIDWFIELHWVF